MNNMSLFGPLEALLEFDFTQMRAKKISTGACATDEAITEFVLKLNSFFAQFKQPPSVNELNEYMRLMGKILERINDSEIAYYTEKHKQEDKCNAKQAADIAQLYAIPTVDTRKLGVRMQFWAASEQWGDSIRNPSQHIYAIEKMHQWENWHAATQKEPQDHAIKGTSDTPWISNHIEYNGRFFSSTSTSIEKAPKAIEDAENDLKTMHDVKKTLF